ncbi:MAG TPA: NDP-sugar synthase [Actinomycetota bacterium]|nr:NDP-sugar synthase [Actinomycetota bacterium]
MIGKAVVLVGGQGTRMRPLTDTIPKPLIPLINRPLLDHVLDHLARHGVSEAVLSSPYLGARFEAFLSARSAPPELRWVTEETPLGTSGAVAGVADLLDDTFLVVNGDVLTDIDLGALVRFHRQRGGVGTIALTEVDDARPFGLVETTNDGRVLAFREKPTERIPGTINAGTYVLEPEALSDVPRGVPVSIERETFPSLISGGAGLYARVSRGYWRDLGTPESYLAAQLDALEGRFQAPTGSVIDAAASIDEAAQVSGTVLGPGCSIAEDARVARSALLAGARIGVGARVEDSILGPGSSVGEGATIRASVLGEGAVVLPGASLDEERLPGPATRLPAG